MELLKKISVSMLVILGCANTPGTSFASDTITAAEIEHFEHTWESWTRDIVKEIHPGLKLTVIARMEFSQSPEQLETYEEMKTIGHLPGLPEVNDPNYTRPLDSPLYALIARKHIRVILHEAIPAAEKALIEEVIRAKMKILSGDQFSTEIIPVAEKTGPQRNPSSAVILLALLGLGVAMIVRRRVRPETIPSPPSAPAKITPTEAPAPASPTPAAKSPIPANHQIMTSDPSARRLALSREKIDVLAKASLNCSTRFTNQILGGLDQARFDLVNQWLLQNQRIVTLAESNYARLLLSARIQQIENQKLISAISSLKTRTKNQENSL